MPRMIFAGVSIVVACAILVFQMAMIDVLWPEAKTWPQMVAVVALQVLIVAASGVCVGVVMLTRRRR